MPEDTFFAVMVIARHIRFLLCHLWPLGYPRHSVEDKYMTIVLLNARYLQINQYNAQK